MFDVILHFVFECSITTQVKQEAVGLYEKLQDLEEKKAEIINENQKRGTPKEERERLLLQVNITYNNHTICFDALIHMILHDSFVIVLKSPQGTSFREILVISRFGIII